jgi:hypothetical protein
MFCSFDEKMFAPLQKLSVKEPVNPQQIHNTQLIFQIKQLTVILCSPELLHDVHQLLTDLLSDGAVDYFLTKDFVGFFLHGGFLG